MREFHSANFTKKNLSRRRNRTGPIVQCSLRRDKTTTRADFPSGTIKTSDQGVRRRPGSGQAFTNNKVMPIEQLRHGGRRNLVERGATEPPEFRVIGPGISRPGVGKTVFVDVADDEPA
jgi:hypothetical protein